MIRNPPKRQASQRVTLLVIAISIVAASGAIAANRLILNARIGNLENKVKQLCSSTPMPPPCRPQIVIIPESTTTGVSTTSTPVAPTRTAPGVPTSSTTRAPTTTTLRVSTTSTAEPTTTPTTTSTTTTTTSPPLITLPTLPKPKRPA